MPPEILKSGQHDEDFYRELWETIETGQDFQSVFINKRKDGNIYYAEQSISPIFDEKGKITHYVSVSIDVTERIEAEKALLTSATQDKLTGLNNRNHGESLLRGAYVYALAKNTGLHLIICIEHHELKTLGQVTISLGLATLKNNETLEQLISRCNEALYHAKHHGRNRLSIAKA